LGAEAFAAYALSKDNTPKTDAADDSWAGPIVLSLDDGIGDVKGNLEDLQGRFNLNNLIKQDGSRNDTVVVQFQNLLQLLKIDTKYATRMLDWIDDNSIPDPVDGAEDATYAGQSPSYLAANMVITRTSELMSILGMTQDEYTRLEPFVAALPVGAPLNICTASSIVLDSMDDAGNADYSSNPEAFAKNRSNGGCFPTVANLKSAWTGHKAFDDLLKARADYIGETTNYFRANILVTIGTTEFALYSVLNRVSTGTTGKTRVIQRSFGTT
jgi:general secretion pathway protein K